MGSMADRLPDDEPSDGPDDVIAARPPRAGRHSRPSAPARRRRRLYPALATLLLFALAIAAIWELRRDSGPVERVVAPRPVVEVRSGQTVDTIAAAMATATGWSASTVDAAFADPQAVGVPAEAPSVEGWLSPGLYDVAQADTPVSLVTKMVARQRDAVAATGLPAAAKRLHRTVTDLLTIASIAQAEAIPSQYGKVARVVANRLAAGMPLQMDATLNYAHGTHVLAHTSKQLLDPSAYNSYARKGLPPTPIGNPDDNAMRAAADPPAGNWIYFVLVDKDGTQLFTADFAEFNRAKDKAKAAGLF